MKATADRIDSLFRQWRELQPLNPDDLERLEYKIRLHWNYHSNHIEGNTLSYHETELLLIHGRYDGGHTERDYTEMKAHDVAVKKVQEYAQDKEYVLTEKDIRDFNKIILKEPYYKKAQTSDGRPTQKKIIPGEYKTQPNHVVTASGEVFKFAEPMDVPGKMKKLLDWFREEMVRPTMNIASFIARVHHEFILIHPFDDGNGRVARLWVNYILLRKDYPPIVIKSENKNQYLAALNRADAGDLDSFATYLGEILVDWLEIAIKAGKGESIEEPGDVDKEIENLANEVGFNKPAKFSQEEVGKICERFLYPIHNELLSGLQRFERFFEEKTSSFQVNEKKLAIIGSNTPFKYDISFRNLKIPTSGLIAVRCIFVLQEEGCSWNITISSGKEDSIRRFYKYHEHITKAELDGIVSECKKKFLNLLKVKMNKR